MDKTAKKHLLDSGDDGTRFIMLVVVMMTVLATIAVGGAMTLAHLRATWVDAVQGNITIEIPASDGKGVIRNAGTLAETARAVEQAISGIEGVTSVHIMDRGAIASLVSPWIGESANTADMPLPALMGVTLKNPDDQNAIKSMTAKITAIDGASVIETHQSWLSDLRRFSLVLLLAAAGMAAITIACCIVAVAGAVAARLSEHHADIDLLHVMGATDNYIGQEFVEAVVRSVGGAAAFGTLLGLGLIQIAGVVVGKLQSAMLPAVTWSVLDYLWFLALPVLVTALCFAAARFTVLRSLRSMP